jgi:hypothetical protein
MMQLGSSCGAVGRCSKTDCETCRWHVSPACKRTVRLFAMHQALRTWRGNEAGKNLIVVSKIDVIGVRKLHLVPAGHTIPYGDETIGRLDSRRRSEQERVNKAEDCGIHPDAQGKGENGDGGEPWVLPQLPEPVADVLKQDLHAAPFRAPCSLTRSSLVTKPQSHTTL